MFSKKNLGNPNILFLINSKKFLIEDNLLKCMENQIYVKNNMFLQNFKRMNPHKTKEERRRFLKKLLKCPTMFSMLSLTRIEINYCIIILKQFSVRMRARNRIFHISGWCSTISIALWFKLFKLFKTVLKIMGP